MAPNLRSYRKNLTTANVTYYKNSDCNQGCSARLIVSNNEIIETSEHNCEANRIVIPIPATNLSSESSID
ncbi:hypothetical protein HZS_5749 [Henneguya salminicola]|nr:hypothetical protein HZS_5749 [Henneguya salminicola]